MRDEVRHFESWKQASNDEELSSDSDGPSPERKKHTKETRSHWLNWEEAEDVTAKLYNKPVEMLLTSAVVKTLGGINRFIDTVTDMADSESNSDAMLLNCTTRLELSFKVQDGVPFNQRKAIRTMKAAVEKVERVLIRPNLRMGFSVRHLWTAFWSNTKSMVFLANGLHVMQVYGRNDSKYVGHIDITEKRVNQDQLAAIAMLYAPRTVPNIFLVTFDYLSQWSEHRL